MSSDLISQLSLGSAGLVIFVLCVGFMLLRGMTRMVINTLIFCLSAWVAYRVWQAVPSLPLSGAGAATVWITNGVPLLAFVAAYFVSGKVVKTLCRPFGGMGIPSPPSSCLARVFMALFALVPTTLISLVSTGVIHHAGSIAEVRAAGSQEKSTWVDFSQKLNSTLDMALPSSWLAMLDPVSQSSRIALAKLITAQAGPAHAVMIDPATGKPVPRAILVADPELQTLARDGNFDMLLRHPLLTKALDDPKVRKLVEDLRR